MIVRPDGHSIGLRGHEEDRYALRPGSIRVRAGEDDEHIGGLGVGDEALAAVDDVVIADAFGLRPQARGVGSCLGLGEGEGGDDVPGGQARQPLGLLLVRAVVDEDLAGDAVVRAEQRAEGRGGVAKFHSQQRILLGVQSQAAVFLGQGPPEEAHLCGFGDDRLGEGVVVFDLCLERDDLLADEFANGGQDVLEFRAVHGSSPSGRWASADPRYRTAVRLRRCSAPGRSSWSVLEQFCGSSHISPVWVSIESDYSIAVMNIRARRDRASLLTAVRSTP